jgi:hypothetical protein
MGGRIPLSRVVGKQLVYKLYASCRSMRNQGRNSSALVRLEIEICMS